MKKIITYGSYDMLHIGHINLLTRAKARGDYLIVGVTSDDYDRSRGKLNVIQSQEVRMAAIKELDFVDEVILETHTNQKQEDILKYGIDEFVIGDDWIGYFDYLNEFTKVVYLPRTKGISSTQLRKENIKPLSIGIIGANGDTKRFLKELHFVDFVKCENIYDDKQKNLKKIVQKFDIPNTTSDLKQFLKGDFDAIYICNDIQNHAKHIRNALEAGKHVLCENPLVLDQNEAKKLFKLAKENNLLLLMALKTAFAPAFNKLLDELKKGTIGEIKEVRAMSYPSLIIQKIAGKSKTIDFFTQKNSKYDVSNRAVTTHKKGVLGIATVGIGMKLEGSAIISGTKGYVYIPAPWWLTKEFYFKFEDEHKSYKFKYAFEGDGLRYMISEFTSLIRAKKIESTRLTIKDMLELNKIIATYNKGKK